MRVAIITGARLESQANAEVRLSIMSGWTELLGVGNVVSANLASAGGLIQNFRPDIMIGIGSYLPETTYFGEIARDAREVGAVPVFWATEDPYEQDANYRILHDFDVVFSCDHWGVNFYDHPHARHLPLAGCRRSHYVPIEPGGERPIDVLFCGVAFSSRKAIVQTLMPSLAGLNIEFIGPGWGVFGPGFSDRRIDKGELIRRYGSTKIVLNLGRSLHFENRRYMITPSSPGPRTFETALAGTLQFFHEDTYEIRRYFGTDEVPSFSTAGEFRSLLGDFLQDDHAREAVAGKAQHRALSEHTYAHRAQHIIDTLRSEGFL